MRNILCMFQVYSIVVRQSCTFHARYFRYPPGTVHSHYHSDYSPCVLLHSFDFKYSALMILQFWPLPCILDYGPDVSTQLSDRHLNRRLWGQGLCPPCPPWFLQSSGHGERPFNVCAVNEWRSALLTAHLILYQPVTCWTFLAARPRPVVEIVLFTLVTATSHKAFPTFAAAVVFALKWQGALRVTVTGCRGEGKEDVIWKRRKSTFSSDSDHQ